MIGENIYNYLVSLSDLLQLINKRSIGYVDVAQDRGYPKLTFNLISAPILYQSDDQWQRWRFWIFAKDQFIVEDIANVLRTNFQRLQGDMGGQDMLYVTKIDETETVRSEETYEKTLDFRFTFIGG